MEATDTYELHEKARKRIKQKKRLYYHFILFVIGSIFFVVLNKIIKFKPEFDWYKWLIFIWLFLLAIHSINVFIMNRFFGKEWIQVETEKLIHLHKEKTKKLESKLAKKGSFASNDSLFEQED